ncbi:hypothetical protein CPB86DRAFT_591131 [Serendipita vermifera]|nr:hypothetical protein CPB86DRAFT_591131 [Serendipita vermifera]
MPGHQRKKSTMRAASLPPSSPPPMFSKPSHAARDKQRHSPIVPSTRRQRVLEKLAETHPSHHIHAALQALPPRRTSAPSTLGSPISLRTSSGDTYPLKEEDEEMFTIHRPDGFRPQFGYYDDFEAREVAAVEDWQYDPFDPSPVYVHGVSRPRHKHKRSNSDGQLNALQAPSQSQQHLLVPQPTLLSATPSPSISASNSPMTPRLVLTPELDFVDLPAVGVPSMWPGFTSPSVKDGVSGMNGGVSTSHLSTPAFSTPALSPSASSAAGSPFPVVAGPSLSQGDYFSLGVPRVQCTPSTPRPVPE